MHVITYFIAVVKYSPIKGQALTTAFCQKAIFFAFVQSYLIESQAGKRYALVIPTGGTNG